MYKTKDPITTGHIAIVLLWLWLAGDIALSASSLFTINVLGGFGGTIAEQSSLELADTLSMWIGLTYLLLFVASGIAVLRWISLTNRNAQTFGDGLEITPGWAIGWFFIPVASLFKPFQGVSATWRTTVNPAAPDTVDLPALLRVWWGLWVASSIAGNIDFRLSMAAKTAPDLITSNWFSAITLAVDIPLAIVLTTLIKQLSAMQSEVLGRDEHAIGAHDEPMA